MTLFNRIRHADIYHRGGDAFTLVTGGGISNRQDWNGENELWTPERFTFADIVNEGGNIRSISTGHWKYAFNKGKTSQGGFAPNEFRVYPLRGRHDVYYSIAPQTAVDLEYEEIPARKAIKIYKDTPDVQWAFYVGIDGWKLANFVRPTYSSDSMVQRFNVSTQGLDKVERFLLYQGMVVAKLPNPVFIETATGDTHEISESLNAGELILSIDGLQGMNLSQGGIFDPTLGPINPNMDTLIYQATPTSGFGQEIYLNLLNRDGNRAQRTLIQFDASAIPAGSTITSSTYEQYQSGGSGPDKEIYCDRLTVYDWEDASGANNEANWTNYKASGPTAWPGGAGAGGDTDSTNRATATVGASTNGTWVSLALAGMTQDAIDNRSGLLNMFIRFTTENVATFSSTSCRSLEYTTAADRPKLTVVYELGGQKGGLMGGGFWGQKTLMGGGEDI